MTVRQPALPLGFGPIHWETLDPDVRARVLELWIQLLQEYLLQRTGSEAEGEAS